MKVIGLIGGMSWESSIEYYRIINQRVKEKLGGLHSAKILMYSLNFEEIEKLQIEGNWNKLTDIISNCAQTLEKSGAGMILICTNTMHMMADEVQKAIKIPLIHIADTVAEQIKSKNLGKVGLLGTKYTMEQEFYKGRLKKKHDIDVLIPNTEEREIIHDVIFKELCLGEIKQSSREKYKKIIDNLIENGAEGIVLGCTEIPLLINQNDIEIPIFDTMTIHAEFAVTISLNNKE